MNTIKEGPVSSGSLAIQDLLPTLARHLMWLDPAKCREALIMPIPAYALEDRDDAWWEENMAVHQLGSVVHALDSLTPVGLCLDMDVNTNIVGYWAS